MFSPTAHKVGDTMEIPLDDDGSNRGGVCTVFLNLHLDVTLNTVTFPDDEPGDFAEILEVAGRTRSQEQWRGKRGRGEDDEEDGPNYFMVWPDGTQLVLVLALPCIVYHQELHPRQEHCLLGWSWVVLA
jgi:hypothetical protein